MSPETSLEQGKEVADQPLNPATKVGIALGIVVIAANVVYYADELIQGAGELISQL